ncbi:MAG: YqzL family protein [Oscillospiraceae bacterium]|nr:YqzL family protein [Oscillospiraceae bacterium]
MNELNRISWETFARTGDIEAYLLYKSTAEPVSQEDKEDIWQKSEQEVLS